MGGQSWPREPGVHGAEHNKDIHSAVWELWMKESNWLSSRKTGTIWADNVALLGNRVVCTEVQKRAGENGAWPQES